MAAQGLILKKGTIVDAVILPSGNRPLSDKKREELAQNPSAQIDTDARSTKKRGTWYFGYKGHVGVDVESKLIRKVTFTPAHLHDSTQTETLVSYDEGALFGDKAYFPPRRIINIQPVGMAGFTGSWISPPAGKPSQRGRRSETANSAAYEQESNTPLPG